MNAYEKVMLARAADRQMGSFYIDHIIENFTELHGDRALEGMTVQNKITGETRRLDCAAVFVAVGKVADSSFLGDLVPTDAGYILADESCRTPCPGLFAAGDCRSKTVRQLTTAVADGSAAATAAIEYLNEQ